MMIRALMNKVDTMQEHRGKVSRDLKIRRKNDQRNTRDKKKKNSDKNECL